MIVDSHHHFWDTNRADYPWMTGEQAAIRRPFGPQDLRPALNEVGVDATVLVQTRSSEEETREFLQTAAETAFVAGVIGWIDLTDPTAPEHLEDLRRAPGGEWLVGVRHQVHDEEDDRWLLRPDVLRGLEAVADAGLVYDLLVKPRELPSALAVARRFTHLSFVVDHIAKPRIAAGPDPEWEEGMRPLADLENVTVKVSGMVTEAEWKSWKPADLAPFVQSVKGWFGPERLLFGSDWPVCLVAAEYSRVLSALLEALGDVTAGEREAILGENARRVYRLGAEA
ncbi:MAG TPA: amidohydrolase family protein [Candidatus Dormibacteraeota bacterium]|nr:amidohydrolase family protein [Candidatus Dormibacteraeota bacterium]